MGRISICGARKIYAKTGFSHLHRGPYFHGSRSGSRVGSGASQKFAGRVGSGQVAVGSGGARNLTGRVGSCEEVIKHHGSRSGDPDPDPTRPDPRQPIRHVKSTDKIRNSPAPFPGT